MPRVGPSLGYCVFIWHLYGPTLPRYYISLNIHYWRKKVKDSIHTAAEIPGDVYLIPPMTNWSQDLSLAVLVSRHIETSNN